MSHLFSLTKQKYFTIMIVLLAVTIGFFGFRFILKTLESPSYNYQIEFPFTYDQSLVLSVLGQRLSIKPVNALAAERISAGQAVKYIDAYQNTDVVQTKQTTKLKEEIILKKPGHPKQFQYQIDINQYDFTRDGQGNLVFYKKGHQGEDLYKIFTIPAPFMIEANGRKSSIKEVRALFDRGILTLIPSQDWLNQAVYPVILDPTIEIHILNVHSHPKQGENWQVNFTTLGKADLKIIPNDQATIDDDEFVGLWCGDEKRVPEILEGDVIYYPDWECLPSQSGAEAGEGIGKIVHYTKKAGHHTLRFEFGLPEDEASVQVAWAYNAPVPAFEAGEITIDDSLEWTNITLSDSYSTAPVILVTPVTCVNCPGTCSGTSAGNGGMYPIPLVRNVTTSSFDISMCVDGGNAACSTGMSTETFHWFAFDVDDATNYNWIEVDTTANVATNGSDTAETYTTSFVSTPDVWTQAQTYSQDGEIGAHAWVEDNGKSTDGFTYVGCVHTGTGDTCDTNNPSETFGYVAIDTTNQAFSEEVNFQSGMVDISNSAWTSADFSPNYTNPRVMVTQNDDDGGQDPEYAWAKDVTSSGMYFRYCEEDAGNVCNTHTSEKTYWFAVEEPVSNHTPTNDSLDLLSHNDGDEIYAGQQYTWQVLVTDDDGCTDIDTVVLKLDYDGSSQDITWTQATDTFASGSGFFTVDSDGDDSSCAGNQWTLDFKLTLDWDWTATDDTDTDAQVVTTDDSAASDTDAYLTDTFQVENDLRTTSISYDSTQNPSTSYTVTGYLDYEDVTSPSPPEDVADIRIDPSWTGDNYDDTDLAVDGAFSINVTSDSSLGNEGAFDVDVINAPTGAGTTSSDGNSMDIDRVQITDIVISNYSYDSGSRYWDPDSASMTATVSAILEDAATAITAGTATLESASYGGDAGSNISQESAAFSSGDAAVTLNASSYASASGAATYDNLYVSAISADSNNYGTALTHGSGIDETSERPEVGWDDVAPSGGSLAWGAINTTDITVNPSGGSDSNSGLPTNKYYLAYDQAESFSSAEANSGWTNTAWNPTGLSANTAYAFVLKLKDNAGKESAAWINPSPVYKYTLANTPSAPTLSNPTGTTIDVNPVSGGAEKEMAIYVEEGDSCDGADGLGYLQANGTIDSSAVWQSDATWGTITVTGLSEQTEYSFCVKARNGDNTETSFGSAGSESCPEEYIGKIKKGSKIKFQGSIKFD